MSGFVPVFKKELRSFFLSPIAYVVIGMFLLISGITFWVIYANYATYSLQAVQNPYMAMEFTLTEFVFRSLFSTITVFMLLIMPLLTMRSFSEEKKTGTIELLLTYPISDIQAILGKFAAALMVFAIMLVLTVVYPLLVWWTAEPELGPIVAGYLGLLLLGSAFLALGVFTSSLTENQIVAAVISFGAYLTLWFIGWAKDLVSPGAGAIMKELSVLEHFEPFSKGLIETQHVIFYVLFTFFFLFLTSRVLESKKWRG